MKKPNLFILGAPKCGTTALSHWLNEHPEIYISDPKEPHFFNFDSKHRIIQDLNDYEKLFEPATERHFAVGEASVWYLISTEAVERILEYQPNAKFIVCVRNPIEMAVSLHDQKFFSGDENIEDFEEAWRSQEGRSKGLIRIPSTCPELKHLLYGEACKLGRLLEKTRTKVEDSQLLVVVLDDIRSDAHAEYQRVLDFLGVRDDGRRSFEIINSAKENKIIWIKRLMRHIDRFKLRFRIKRGTGIGKLIKRWNRKERPSKGISKELRQELAQYFSEDVELLSRQLGRDFSRWLK